MTQNQLANQMRAKLCAKSVMLEADGAKYDDRDLALIDIQFDLTWENVYGYHPFDAVDYEGR
jgi:hypothetical protein